jgi:Ca2+-binding RTX toxin-like protein
MPTRKWGTEAVVNTTTSGNQARARVANLTGGGYVVVWEDDGLAFSAIRAQIYDTAGNRLGGQIDVIIPPSNQEIMPEVTGLADGGFAVNWTQLVGAANYILGSIYNAQGGFVRSQPAAFGGDLITNEQVTRFGAGTAVVWEEPAGFTEIDLRTFNAAGVGSSVTRVNTFQAGSRHDPTVAASPDQSQLAIAWEDSGGIFAALYNSASVLIAPEFRIDAAVGAADFQPVVTWLNNSQYVVAWVQSNSTAAGGNDVKARIWQGGSSPTPLTSIFTVNTTTAGDQQAPAITALPDGGFAVAWEDDSGIGLDGGAAIRLQAFDAAGAKIGGEIIVNTTTAGVQDQPSLAALPDGRIAVTWRDASASGGDASGTAIRTQIIDPRDGVITGTPAAETLYGNDLVGDEISAGAGNDQLYGLRGDDVLYGGDGNDMLNGGIGADVMAGGAGNDTYYVDIAGDAVVEADNAGTDQVFSPIGYTLSQFVENLTLNGTANLNMNGNALSNTLVGNSGNNIIDGMAGADVMIGGAGNDTYRVDNSSDSEVEADNGGTDQVFSSVSYVLRPFVENLTLTGTANLNTNGNALDNKLFGNAGNNVFDGMAGADVMVGNGGSDTFGFTTSLVAGNIDTITDFRPADDKIRLTHTIFNTIAGIGALSADQFTANTSGTAQDANDRIIYETDTGKLFYDSNGSAAGGAVQFAKLSSGLALTANNFSII